MIDEELLCAVLVGALEADGVDAALELEALAVGVDPLPDEFELLELL